MTAELSVILHKLQASDTLEYVAVISMDGLLIEAATVPEADPQQVAAVACNGLLMARAMGGELGRGEPIQIIIEYHEGLLVLVPLNDDLGLVMLGPKEANLGRLRLLARRYASDLLAAAAI